MDRLLIARTLVAAIDDDQVRVAIDKEHEARELARARRAPRGGSRALPPTCPACHKWVVNISATCSCGWSPITGWAG